ncbi:hypothetical protein OESDEN_11139, partial [Oesophagostomum dentatum]
LRARSFSKHTFSAEVLDKKGHSFEVDIWAIGCILYTLLFGRPPFETKSLKETYSRIKMNQYRLPSTASQTAAHLIQNLLAADPAKRPTVKQVILLLKFCALRVLSCASI